ncbi:mitochondrial fission regulator 2 isoform X1 [Scleropages formosus]|uniref:Mitochondrial fission regulator n=2 Tax=Scleropages formosus TaxID=113540 RepID=A0A8C9S311_SCLFO|nr:mitochondrial fission regulator 2 isoform X1 [Scleropages formosus]
MSLFADVLELVRYILEYFGVPADVMAPVWENGLCGQYRSLVRMIGTKLPLTPCPRVHFQVPLLTPRWHDGEESPDKGPAVPSFADVMWVSTNDSEPFAKLRNCIRRPGSGGAHERPMALALRTRLENIEEHSNIAALKKITALEDELLRLRAQIAKIVSSSPGPVPPQNNLESPERPLTSPLFTSTPHCPLPPPPAPPLPPPLPVCGTTHATSRDLPTQCCPEVPERPQQVAESKCGKAPRMMEVLKELNQVKLRAVDRSPGGTPVRKVRTKEPAPSSDPAAIIAEALKRKFAHRRQDDSFDKENRSFESSPFGSPEVPSVAHHVRREQGRLHL